MAACLMIPALGMASLPTRAISTGAHLVVAGELHANFTDADVVTMGGTFYLILLPNGSANAEIWSWKPGDWTAPNGTRLGTLEGHYFGRSLVADPGTNKLYFFAAPLEGGRFYSFDPQDGTITRLGEGGTSPGPAFISFQGGGIAIDGDLQWVAGVDNYHARYRHNPSEPWRWEHLFNEADRGGMRQGCAILDDIPVKKPNVLPVDFWMGTFHLFGGSNDSHPGGFDDDHFTVTIGKLPAGKTTKHAHHFEEVLQAEGALPQRGCSAAYHAESDTAYVISPGPMGGPSPTLWSYKATDMSLTRLPTYASWPTLPTEGISAARMGNAIYLFGGTNAGGLTNRTYAYHPGT